MTKFSPAFTLSNIIFLGVTFKYLYGHYELVDDTYSLRDEPVWIWKTAIGIPLVKLVLFVLYCMITGCQYLTFGAFWVLITLCVPKTTAVKIWASFNIRQEIESDLSSRMEPRY